MDEQPKPNGATILEMLPGQKAFGEAAQKFANALIQGIARSGGQVDVANTIVRMNLMSCHMEQILAVLALHGVDIDETYKRAAASLEMETARMQAPQIALANGFRKRN
jgi:hypothetical protein